LAGRLDSKTSAAVGETLTQLIESGDSKIVLDCGALEYVSSAGLRILHVAARAMRAKQGKLVIAALREDVRQVFEIAGFTTTFAIYRVVADAARSIG
jgi:anti-anti-sigma factor